MSDGQSKRGSGLQGDVPPEIQRAPKMGVEGGSVGEVVASRTSGAELKESHNQFADFHQNYVSTYIGLADTKAAWIFAVASALIGFLFGSEDFQGVLLHPMWSMKFLVMAATILLLGLSAVFSFLVIVPRLRNSGEDSVYFGAVAKRPSADDYVRDIASKGAAELTEVRLRHCYDISRVGRLKYANLRKAVWFGVPGLLGVLLALLST